MQIFFSVAGAAARVKGMCDPRINAIMPPKARSRAGEVCRGVGGNVCKEGGRIAKKAAWKCQIFTLWMDPDFTLLSGRKAQIRLWRCLNNQGNTRECALPSQRNPNCKSKFQHKVGLWVFFLIIFIILVGKKKKKNLWVPFVGQKPRGWLR